MIMSRPWTQLLMAERLRLSLARTTQKKFGLTGADGGPVEIDAAQLAERVKRLTADELALVERALALLGGPAQPVKDFTLE